MLPVTTIHGAHFRLRYGKSILDERAVQSSDILYLLLHLRSFFSIERVSIA